MPTPLVCVGNAMKLFYVMGSIPFQSTIRQISVSAALSREILARIRMDVLIVVARGSLD